MTEKTTGRFVTREGLEKYVKYLHKNTSYSDTKIAKNVCVSRFVVYSILKEKSNDNRI